MALVTGTLGPCLWFTEEDEKTYKSDPFYQCPYSESDIRRVGNLPSDFMSAFSQLRSASDFRLHYLLSKYTFGDVRCRGTATALAVARGTVCA